jgi:hypothetical protein
VGTPMTILNGRVFLRGCDLSGQSNKLGIEVEATSEDVTNCRSGGAQEVIAGIVGAKVSGGGQVEYGLGGTVDYDAWSQLGGRDSLTLCPDLDAVGDLAYLTDMFRGKYDMLGELGKVNTWTMNGSSSGPIARGKILHPSGTARSSTGDGTAVQVAALTEGQRLQACLHVLSLSAANTLDVTVESDSVATFDASAETRITFTQATATGDGQISRTAKAEAGGHADTWYRVTWEVTGGGSSLFVISLGIV